MGELWIHLPGMGKWLERARQPIPMMLMAGLAGFLLVAPKRAVQRLRKRAHRPPAQRRQEKPQYSGGGGPAGILGPDGQTAMTVVGVLALAAVLLALLAFSRPTERATTAITEYQHSGSFDYRAAATGDVYEGGEVDAGQPVYLALVDAIDLSFAYSLTSELPADAAGTYRLDAIVAYDEGLARTIPLVPETPFEGGRFTAEAQLALSDARQYIDQVARQIGVESGATGRHRVSIVPTVNLSGTVGGQAVEETFAPALEFELDDVALRPAEAAAAPAPAAGAEGLAADPLAPVQSGIIEQPATAPATLSFLMLDIEVATARQAAIFGLVLSALAGAILAGLYLSARRAAEPRQIQGRYRPLLIKVNGSDLGVNGRVVEVASIEDLARVAEREGRMILHQQRGSTHDYFVQDVDVTYCYTSNEGAALVDSVAMEPSR